MQNFRFLPLLTMAQCARLKTAAEALGLICEVRDALVREQPSHVELRHQEVGPYVLAYSAAHVEDGLFHLLDDGIWDMPLLEESSAQKKLYREMRVLEAAVREKLSGNFKDFLYALPVLSELLVALNESAQLYRTDVGLAR